MKKSLKLTCALLVSILFFACSNENQDVKLENLNYKLESPNGNILAKTSNQLKDIILNNSNITNKNDLAIKNVRYNENNTGSFAIVDFLNKEENGSMFVPLSVNENYSLFIDGENIYINEIPKNVSLEKTEDLNILYLKKEEVDKDLSKRVSYVCNGSCCGWSQPGENHYHCGCPATSFSSSADMILSTSDGCVIQVIQK